MLPTPGLVVVIVLDESVDWLEHSQTTSSRQPGFSTASPKPVRSRRRNARTRTACLSSIDWTTRFAWAWTRRESSKHLLSMISPERPHGVIRCAHHRSSRTVEVVSLCRRIVWLRVMLSLPSPLSVLGALHSQGTKGSSAATTWSSKTYGAARADPALPRG